MIAKLSLPLILALASIAHAAEPETVAGAPEAQTINDATEDLVDKAQGAEQKVENLKKANEQLETDKTSAQEQAENSKKAAQEAVDETEGAKVETQQAQVDAQQAQTEAQEAKAGKTKAEDQANESTAGAQQLKSNVQEAINNAQVNSPPVPQTSTDTTSQQDPTTSTDGSKQDPTTSTNGSKQDPSTPSNGQQGSSTTSTEPKKGLWAKVPDMPIIGAKARAARNWFPKTREHLVKHKWAYGVPTVLAGGAGLALANGKLVKNNGEVNRQLVDGDVVPAIAVPQGEATHQAYLAKESGASTLAFVGALATTAVAALTLAL